MSGQRSLIQFSRVIIWRAGRRAAEFSLTWDLQRTEWQAQNTIHRFDAMGRSPLLAGWKKKKIFITHHVVSGRQETPKRLFGVGRHVNAVFRHVSAMFQQSGNSIGKTCVWRQSLPEKFPEGKSKFKGTKLQRHCCRPIKVESTIGNLRVHKTTGRFLTWQAPEKVCSTCDALCGIFRVLPANN